MNVTNGSPVLITVLMFTSVYAGVLVGPIRPRVLRPVVVVPIATVTSVGRDKFGW